MAYSINEKEIPFDFIKAAIRLVEVFIMVGKNDGILRRFFSLFRPVKVETHPVLDEIITDKAFFGLVESMNVGNAEYWSGYYSRKYGWAKDINGERLAVQGGIKELSKMLIDRKIIVLSK